MVGGMQFSPAVKVPLRYLLEMTDDIFCFSLKYHTAVSLLFFSLCLHKGVMKLKDEKKCSAKKRKLALSEVLVKMAPLLQQLKHNFFHLNMCIAILFFYYLPSNGRHINRCWAANSAWSICVRGRGSKWVLRTKQGGGRESWSSLSSCSTTTLWPFHADDWFRCGEQGEERSGSGLCPLITLHYHTGGIYHQTPKASVRGEHWNQSLRLHAIHPGPRKAALWSATTSIFSVRERGGGALVKGRRVEGLRKEGKQKGREGKRDLKGLWDVSLGTAGGCFCLYLVPKSWMFIQLWLGRLHFIQHCKRKKKS